MMNMDPSLTSVTVKQVPYLKSIFLNIMMVDMEFSKSTDDNFGE